MVRIRKLFVLKYNTLVKDDKYKKIIVMLVLLQSVHALLHYAQAKSKSWDMFIIFNYSNLKVKIHGLMVIIELLRLEYQAI